VKVGVTYAIVFAFNGEGFGIRSMSDRVDNTVFSDSSLDFYVSSKVRM